MGGDSLASIYQTLYLLFVALVTIINLIKYNGYSVTADTSSFKELLMVFAMILVIGLRPISGYFTDMSVYENTLNNVQGSPFVFSTETNNLIFDNLIRWWGCNGFNHHLFFLLIATIYFGCAYWGIKRLFSNYAFAAYLVFLGAFSTFSAGTNGIKAGAAASLFIVALAYRDRLFISTVFLALSLGFHHSMIVPIVAFLSSIIVKNPKYIYAFWFFCLIMAIAHVTYFQYFFASMSDERGSEYLLSDGSDWGGRSTGFRLDFVIYSVLPLVMGWYTLYKRKVENHIYSFILSTYAFTNAIWLLCMYASFTNRIAYLSWLMYPIVLIYPCFLPELGEDRYRIFFRVSVLHLAFTLFMFFIIY